MLGVVVWITMGAFVGSIASLLLKTDEAGRSTLANVTASVAGALLGGLIAHLLGYSGSRLVEILSFQSVLLAGCGSAIMLLVINLVRPRRSVLH